MVAHLPIWGEQLFNAIFTDATAHRFFARLQDSDEKECYITLSSVLPEILKPCSYSLVGAFMGFTEGIEQKIAAGVTGGISTLDEEEKIVITTEFLPTQS